MHAFEFFFESPDYLVGQEYKIQATIISESSSLTLYIQGHDYVNNPTNPYVVNYTITDAS